MNFKGILCEGVAPVLQGRSSNMLYKAPGGLPILLRNARLSDDIAFRFDDPNWCEQPLTAAKFADWLHGHPRDTEVINLFMDYETFGVHKESATGIFDFLKALPAEVLKKEGFCFRLPSEVLAQNIPGDEYDVINTISWDNKGDAACVWSENVMQHNMLRKIYSLEHTVFAAEDAEAIDAWGRLQSADHFYYMTGKNGRYLNPYSSEQEACDQYQQVINNFEISLIRKGLAHLKKSVRTKHQAYGIY